MIWFDVTKSARAGHYSGLTRVTKRLLEELAGQARPTSWPEVPPLGPADWYLTAEVFAPAERPGFDAFVRAHGPRLAAIFHDAIPLRLPQITWPQAVARHAGYLTLLARLGRVWAVSEASRAELTGFWAWQDRQADRPVLPEVRVLALGCDFSGGAAPGAAGALLPGRLLLLQVGIVEPRKGQDFLLELAEELWADGLDFELCVVGRVNPHFGRPIAERLKRARNPSGSPVYAGAVADDALRAKYGTAAACVLPTLAEGCGLPLLEALACGTPCLASHLPALRENAGPGVVLLPTRDKEAWKLALRRFLTDPGERQRLRTEAAERRASLPTWSAAAAGLADGLR